MANHSFYLLEALKLAQIRQGFCAPNPSVGALIVKDNQIIGTGIHYAAGYPHAEVMALKRINEDLEEATLYVTLEPCCHFGRTPPCTDLIISSGIKHVVYAYKDPNSKVSGQGEKNLQSHHINCVQIAIPEIDQFYNSYTYWTMTKRPWVTSKLAISLDGKIAGPLGKSIAITGDAAKQYTYSWRKRSDAILTTVKTIIKDDPQMNIRQGEEKIAKPIYLLDSKLSLPQNAQILKTAECITLFHNEVVDKNKLNIFKDLGITCHAVTSSEGNLNLSEVIAKIGLDGKHDLWVEAGGVLFNSLVHQRLTHKSLIYVAPKILGSDAVNGFSIYNEFFSNAKQINWYPMGRDCVCELDWK